VAESRVTLDVRGIPEVVWAARREVARILRSIAEAELDLHTATRLKDVADAFDCGQRPEASHAD
jgi:hypothetical protein